MTYRSALEYGRQYLEEKEIADASVDAWYLLEFSCGLDRTRYLLRMMDPMPEEEASRYQRLLEKRGSRIPLQHITGVQEFMGFPFQVNEQVLIPRQETELLVETALKELKPGMRVLDLCTGSGCILISLLKLCPGLAGIGLDISPEALEVARQNGDALGVSAEFLESDLFQCFRQNEERCQEKGKTSAVRTFPEGKLPEEQRYDLIVSNPPYIAAAVIGELEEEVRLHDPRKALDGGPDGLCFYRRIVAECLDYLKPSGWLMFEIGHDQGQSVSAMMEKDFTEIRVIQDLAGLDRVVAGRRRKE